MDGLSNFKGLGEGIVIASPKGVIFNYALHFKFPTTNNEAEFEAITTGLKEAKRIEGMGPDVL